MAGERLELIIAFYRLGGIGLAVAALCVLVHATLSSRPARSSMAGERLVELIITFSRLGGIVLTVAELCVLVYATPRIIAIYLLSCALVGGIVQGFGCLLWFNRLDGERPGNVVLLVLMTVVEGVVACFTIGTACAAITLDRIVLRYYGYFAGAGGALRSLSALGMLWIHDRRFPPAQAA